MPYQKTNRKSYTPQFKFDRAVETIKIGNLSEISRKYGVGVNVLSKWRTDLMEQGYRVFETIPDQEVGGLKKTDSQIRTDGRQKRKGIKPVKKFFRIKAVNIPVINMWRRD